jgi:diadenosine tetraphosphate (Ap4A) HIT family hydrolase
VGDEPSPRYQIRLTFSEMNEPESGCPFCQRINEPGLLGANELAAAFFDAFPLSPGHALIAPRRHESDLFRLSAQEQDALWALLREARGRVQESHRPDGYNVGVNVGDAGGQTIGHVHVHLIPRYAGDVEDPRGGIRRIIPAKARYWDR